MQYVICYDVSDDRNRDHLARTLLDFGTRVQESVFVANLDEALVERLRGRVRRFVNNDTDRIHIFALCENCQRKTETIGQAEVPEERGFYVI